MTRALPAMLFLIGGPLVHRAAAAPAPARDLGTPVTSANVISYRTARGLGQGGGDLLCWVTTAESGGRFSAMDLGSGSVLTHPLNHLEGYPIVFGTDQRVYIGSTTGEVMCWDPKTRQWGALGKQLFAVPGRGVNHVRCLVEGRDGWLYAGSCTGQPNGYRWRRIAEGRAWQCVLTCKWCAARSTTGSAAGSAAGYGSRVVMCR